MIFAGSGDRAVRRTNNSAPPEGGALHWGSRDAPRRPERPPRVPVQCENAEAGIAVRADWPGGFHWRFVAPEPFT